ncbi:hypothetical protein FEM48_Zijuj04G0196900 [Ziziphus jujuba var. spinosa]|uniref:PGG domain-containing protein n=1 Tax=Ziziphus jujuba var. spinosa TaxID=714518 RepID=A0A978VLT6_ZIZJJ|nr:hypothetical protein FEM48_Zijuj04G0196900 [Ziziphus jujuba var. spinosa]
MLVAALKFEYRAPDLSLEEVRHLLCSFLLHAGNKCVNVGYRKANQPTQTASVVRFTLKPRLESLINAADNEGNTPLHVAAGRDKYRIITILVNEIKVHKKAQNHNFQKPSDLIRTNPNIGALYKASGLSMIAMRLEKQGGQPSLHSLVHKAEYRKPIKKDITINRVGSNRDKDHDHTSKEVGYDQDKDVKSNRLKNISTIHLLVATLIATMTFTAGFTMPGGFEQNESSRKGLALLSDNAYFHLFVITDSLAFYYSSASVFLQFCAASEHNYHLLLRFTKVSATLIYISSLGMVVAFTSALHAVMPGSSMLAYYTFVSGICCVVAYIFGFL